MTRYMSSLKRLCVEEIDKLGAARAGFDARRLRKLVFAGEHELAAQDQAARAEVLKRSTRLATIATMREELATLWARSTASKEQLLKQLHDWLERAEQSGIQQLQEFSLRLRCYAT
jgi:stearoyl-CoA desaturase (delta-9 desaturase)